VAAGTLVITLLVYSCFMRPLGLKPFGGHVEGTVTGKNRTVWESRYGSRVESALTVATAPGTEERVVVPPDVFALAERGCRLTRTENRFYLNCPGRPARVFTEPPR